MEIYYNNQIPYYYLSLYFGGRFPCNGLSQWNFNITPRPCYTIIHNNIENSYLILDMKFGQDRLGKLFTVYFVFIFIIIVFNS